MDYNFQACGYAREKKHGTALFLDLKLLQEDSLYVALHAYLVVPSSQFLCPIFSSKLSFSLHVLKKRLWPALQICFYKMDLSQGYVHYKMEGYGNWGDI